ncbi:MAG: hypothetical protein HC811_11085, partial [Flammeovirgaceae bacterium]|nr:hypothetical protein [Flammeovirgaceae bacterium]
MSGNNMEVYFDFFVWAWIGLAFITFIYLLYKPAPYGRHTSLSWGPMISNRTGWVVMELPVLFIVVVYLFNAIDASGPTTLILFGLFIFHYINRVFIYPFRLSTKGKQMPLIIALSAVLFNSINGNVIGYSLMQTSYEVDYTHSINFIVGGVLFFTGVILNWKSDAILISLRNGSEGYKIPTGWLFEKISC